MARMVVGLALLAACTTGDGTILDDVDVTGAVPTGDSGGGITITDPRDTSAALSGNVSTLDGTPVEDADIRFCLATGECRFSATDAQGNYAFEDVVVEWHAFEVKPPFFDGANDPFEGYIVGFVPLAFETDQVRSVDMPLLEGDAPTTLPASSPTEIEVGSGLFVTLSADMLKPPTFEDPATEVAGILVPDNVQPPVDSIEGTVLAMWFMGPFDHEVTGGADMRIRNDWKLKDGTTYEVWVGSYPNSSWLDAGDLTVKGGWLEGDARLPRISTVLLVDPGTKKGSK